MLPEFKRFIICISGIVSLNCACSSDNEISLADTDAEMFLYDSPITALTDAGDSLLLGTARGDIVSFSLMNGTFRHLFHDEEGRYIYKVLKADDSYLYSVQDGGIKHVLADGRVNYEEYFLDENLLWVGGLISDADNKLVVHIFQKL